MYAQNDIGAAFEAMLQIRYTLQSRYAYAAGCMSCERAHSCAARSMNHADTFVSFWIESLLCLRVQTRNAIMLQGCKSPDEQPM